MAVRVYTTDTVYGNARHTNEQRIAAMARVHKAAAGTGEVRS